MRFARPSMCVCVLGGAFEFSRETNRAGTPAYKKVRERLQYRLVPNKSVAKNNVCVCVSVYNVCCVYKIPIYRSKRTVNKFLPRVAGSV